MSTAATKASHVPEQSARFAEILKRLVDKSVDGYYNPYREFDWPDALPEQMPWMSEDLMSTYGTQVAEELTIEESQRLSRWESINFYSLNVEGIRELLIEVIKRIHTAGFELPSDFFHHFIGEENEHMWFFAEFCLRYGNKIYSGPKLHSIPHDNAQVENFLVFSRILLFEEIVDFYNMRMAADDSLHETIRKVNRVHHEDESRHIAFGRELVSMLYAELARTMTDQQRQEIEQYLKRYIVFSLRSFYNPQVYRDARIDKPLEFRERLVSDPARRDLERKVVRKPMSFMVKSGIFADDVLPAI
ncbi:diiron oxygenase [Streptomyces sp. RS10V-4]|uniref:diiron oxygenase n=1 Tax=Streptomyces rhizoryzae TaxID=2932493 RepID=UPI002006AB9A|nr:diiron oxygenase [Streptomyces rhizoryzae]MCK7626488.1 diiron oxygenase [Streptomyces rhizoryzae]